MTSRLSRAPRELPELREGLRFRALTWRDIEALARIEIELFGHEAWSEQSWWAELAAGERRDYVVLEENAVASPPVILGYAGLDLGGEVADVMTIAVAPHAQGRGLGGALMAELISRARGAGAGHLHLEVRADNEPALGLYARYGFEQLRIRPRYYQPDDVDAVIMGLELTPYESEQ